MAEAVLADLQQRDHELTVFGPLAGAKMLVAEAVSKEVMDSWYSYEYEPNPEDDAAPWQIEELESAYRSGQAANPVESRTR